MVSLVEVAVRTCHFCGDTVHIRKCGEALLQLAMLVGVLQDLLLGLELVKSEGLAIEQKLVDLQVVLKRLDVPFLKLLVH